MKGNLPGSDPTETPAHHQPCDFRFSTQGQREPRPVKQLVPPPPVLSCVGEKFTRKLITSPLELSTTGWPFPGTLTPLPYNRPANTRDVGSFREGGEHRRQGDTGGGTPHQLEGWGLLPGTDFLEGAGADELVRVLLPLPQEPLDAPGHCLLDLLCRVPQMMQQEIRIIHE